MATIGNMSIALGVNVDGLTAGLAKAQAKIQVFQQSLASAFSGKSLAGGLLSGGAAAFGGIPVIGTALSAASVGMGKLEEAYDGFVAKTLEASRTSKQFGVSLQQAQVIQYMAGAGSEAFGHGLQHLQREIGAAANGSEEARKKFSALGLDAGQLATMPVTDAWKVFADTIRELPTPAEKAAAAFSIFGKSGQELLPLLEKGSAGFDKASGAVQKYGQYLDETAVKQAKLSAEAKKNNDLAYESFSGNLGDTLWGRGGWEQTKANGWSQANRALNTAGPAAHGNLPAYLSSPNDPSIWKGPQERAREAAAKQYELHGQAASDLAAKLQLQADAFSKSSVQAQVNELGIKGATRAQLAAAQSAATQLKAMQDLSTGSVNAINALQEYHVRAGKIMGSGDLTGKQKSGLLGNLKEQLGGDLDKAAATFYGETRTPLDTFLGQMQLAKELYKTGRSSAEEYGRTVFKLTRDMETAAGVGGPLGKVSAITAGSSAALSAVAEQRNDSGGGDEGARMQAGIEALKSLTSRQLQVSVEIRDAMKSSNIAILN
jgi:hypothetical protein